MTLFTFEVLQDYLSTIAEQLYAARRRREAACVRSEATQTDARARVEAAQSEEQSLWAQFEDYLLEALRWQEQQSGTARLPCALGVFSLEEVPGEVAITDLSQVHEWTRRLSGELVSLSALPVAPQAQSEAPQAQQSLDPGHHAAADALVTRFYRRTGLLPEGCHLTPARRKPMLE